MMSSRSASVERRAMPRPITNVMSTMPAMAERGLAAHRSDSRPSARPRAEVRFAAIAHRREPLALGLSSEALLAKEGAHGDHGTTVQSVQWLQWTVTVVSVDGQATVGHPLNALDPPKRFRDAFRAVRGFFVHP